MSTELILEARRRGGDRGACVWVLFCVEQIKSNWRGGGALRIVPEEEEVAVWLSYSNSSPSLPRLD